MKHGDAKSLTRSADSVTPSPAVLREVQSILSKAAPTNGINPSFSPQQLQKWKSALGAELDSVSPEGKALFGRVRDVLDNVLTSRLTAEQRGAFDAANAQYRNRLAVQEMVKRSNDTGHVTPVQILQASKAVGRNGFAQGNAPYKSLGDALLRLYGKQGVEARPAAHSLSLLDLMTGLGGVSAAGPGGLGAVAVKRAGEVALRRALDSQNASVRDALVGNTGVQRALDRYSGPALAAAIARLATNDGN